MAFFTLAIEEDLTEECAHEIQSKFINIINKYHLTVHSGGVACSGITSCAVSQTNNTADIRAIVESLEYLPDHISCCLDNYDPEGAEKILHDLYIKHQKLLSMIGGSYLST
jgi:hypothetical protein